MADRWRFIRTVLYQIGYDTYDSLDGIELVSISEDGYLYFTDNGVLYKADLDSTEKEPVNPPTVNTLYTLTAVELLDGGSGYTKRAFSKKINGTHLDQAIITGTSTDDGVIDSVSIENPEYGRYSVIPENPYILDVSGATVQLTWSNELDIYTKTFVDGVKGGIYEQVIKGVGGELPYIFSIYGSLPSGITLYTVDDNSALLSGTVNDDSKIYTFDVIIADKNRNYTNKKRSILVRPSK
jgi:hypothetical protein